MVELSVIILDPPSGGAPRPFTLSVNTEDGSAGTYVYRVSTLNHVATCNYVSLFLYMT